MSQQTPALIDTTVDPPEVRRFSSTEVVATYDLPPVPAVVLNPDMAGIRSELRGAMGYPYDAANGWRGFV